MEDFEMIYEDDILMDDCKCTHCGEMVRRGIVTISHHWMHCTKRPGIIIARTDAERKILDSMSINVPKVPPK